VNARTATAAIVAACCALAGVGVIDSPVPTRTVTEIVSVVQLPPRAAAAATPPPASVAADEEEVIEPAQPVQAAPAARASRPQQVAIARRESAPTAAPHCRTVQCGVRHRSERTLRAERRAPAPPEPPHLFARVRDFGLALRSKLVRAGIVPPCDDPRRCEPSS
jgi:hypothetical protein